jgi:hypothetical protein
LGASGYSGKSLAEKLGLRPGMRIALVDAPPGYRRRLGALPDGATFVGPRSRNVDLLHLFSVTRPALEASFRSAKRRIKPDGMLWVSWPKRTSDIVTDLTENIVREIGLAGGLVDIKVAAVDGDWSALKFVYRVTDRPATARKRSRSVA